MEALYQVTLLIIAASVQVYEYRYRSVSVILLCMKSIAIGIGDTILGGIATDYHHTFTEYC